MMGEGPMTHPAEAAGIAERLTAEQADWLRTLAMPDAYAYRMAFDGEVTDGVIEFGEHSGGYMLASRHLKPLFEADLLDVKWPCDHGYVPDWWDNEPDDGDDWPATFECNSYCGECQPPIEFTPLGLAVAHILREQEKTKCS